MVCSAESGASGSTSSNRRGGAPSISSSSWLDIYASPHLLDISSEGTGQASCDSVVVSSLSRGNAER